MSCASPTASAASGSLLVPALVTIVFLLIRAVLEAVLDTVLQP